jgi:rubrerythrin
MEQFKGVDDLLDFAMSKEQEAADLYNRMAGQVDSPTTKKLFKDLEKEELMHKARLKAMKAGRELVPIAPKISDLKIADYLTQVQLKPGMDYQDGLIYAMQAEKAEFRLYMDLHGKTDNQNLQNLLLKLAQEEAQHKLRLELEYDEYILTEN